MIDFDVLAKALGYDTPKLMLEDLYIVQGESAGSIAKLCSTTRSTILSQLRLYEIPIRPRGGINNITEFTKLVAANKVDLTKGTKKLCLEHKVSTWTILNQRRLRTSKEPTKETPESEQP